MECTENFERDRDSVQQILDKYKKDVLDFLGYCEMEVPFVYNAEGLVQELRSMSELYSAYSASYSKDIEMIDKLRDASLLIGLCFMKLRTLPNAVNCSKYDFKSFEFAHCGDIGVSLAQLLKETNSSFLERIVSTRDFFWTKDYCPLEICLQVGDKSIYFIEIPDENSANRNHTNITIFDSKGTPISDFRISSNETLLGFPEKNVKGPCEHFTWLRSDENMFDDSGFHFYSFDSDKENDKIKNAEFLGDVLAPVDLDMLISVVSCRLGFVDQGAKSESAPKTYSKLDVQVK